MGKNIVLIGFMGTGKSSIGLRLAKRLGMEFVDMDREIEKITGLSISALFRLHGEVRFRSEEKLMAKKLSQRSDLVIATGGGVVLDEDNIRVLRENGILICLEASAKDIFRRVSRKKGTRPLLKKDFKIEDIEEMLNKRAAFYSCADYRVNTSGKDLNAVVQEIMELLVQK
ncbi:MAG: shikimate kinase [Syntrophomonadaceae bacterium]|nr:shikimate kinase [Syntrophomonadaceae bacterium]